MIITRLTVSAVVLLSFASTGQTLLDCNYIAFPKWCVNGDCEEPSLSIPVDVCWTEYSDSKKLSCNSGSIVVSIWDNADECSDSISPSTTAEVTSHEYNCNSANQCSYSITETYLIPDGTSCTDGVIPSDITPDQSVMVTDHCWGHPTFPMSLFQSQCDDTGASTYTQYSDTSCGSISWVDKMSVDGTCTPYGAGYFFRRNLCASTIAPSAAPTTTTTTTSSTPTTASIASSSSSKSPSYNPSSSAIMEVITMNISVEYNITTAVINQITLSVEQYLSGLSVDIDHTIDSVVTGDVVMIRLYVTENELQYVNKEELVQAIEADLNEFDSDDTDAQQADNAFEQTTFILIIVLAVFTLVAAIDGKKLRPNDYFQVGSLVAASLQILDCVSDILFAVRITNHPRFPSQSLLLVLFILSVIFILSPVLFSIVQLQKMIHQYWNKNDQMRAWLRDKMYLLLMLSFWCGSSFSAVQLCSSNAFDISLFSMPISKTDKSHFQYKRVYSVVLLENVPQLAIALCFVVIVGGDDIVYISMVFSAVSILMMMISAQATKQLIETEDHSVITIHVTGAIDGNNVGFCQKQTNNIRDYMSVLLGVDQALIEIPKPTQIQNGLRLQVVIFMNYATIIELQMKEKVFEENAKEEIAQFVAKCWKLSESPSVKIVKFEQNQKEQNRVEHE